MRNAEIGENLNSRKVSKIEKICKRGLSNRHQCADASPAKLIVLSRLFSERDGSFRLQFHKGNAGRRGNLEQTYGHRFDGVILRFDRLACYK